MLAWISVKAHTDLSGLVLFILVLAAVACGADEPRGSSATPVPAASSAATVGSPTKPTPPLSGLNPVVSAGSDQVAANLRAVIDRTCETVDADLQIAGGIHIVELATCSVQTLTSEVGDVEPRYSPDGRHLAFVRWDALGADSSTSDIYVLDLATGGLFNLTSTPAEIESRIQWSPDSSSIAYVSSSPSERQDWSREDLRVVELDPPGARRIVIPDWGCSSYEWSPDAARVLAYLCGDTFGSPMKLVDLTNLSTSILADNYSAYGAYWSPDGRAVTYNCVAIYSEPTPTGPSGEPLYTPNRDTCVVLVDTVTLVRLDRSEAPHWLPDGSGLSYSTPRGLVIYKIDGTKEQPSLLQSDVTWITERFATYSICPFSVTDCFGEMRLLDTESARETSLISNACSPAWSPDHSRIVFSNNGSPVRLACFD